MADYKAWVKRMLNTWSMHLNESNNQRSLLPFVAIALAHLGVGLTATYTLKGSSIDEASNMAKEDLCAAYKAALKLLDEALESKSLLSIISTVDNKEGP